MMRAHVRRTRLVGLLAVMAVVTVASCGDDDDGGGDASAPVSGDVAAPGSSADATSADATTDATTEGTVSAGVRTAEENGEPVKGGTLVYGLEADTANGWAPYRSSLATSGYIPLTSITDSLFAVTADGEVVPNLVESVEPNADYTQWTMHLREGITFQDGSPFDGDAVKFNMD